VRKAVVTPANPLPHAGFGLYVYILPEREVDSAILRGIEEFHRCLDPAGVGEAPRTIALMILPTRGPAVPQVDRALSHDLVRTAIADDQIDTREVYVAATNAPLVRGVREPRPGLLTERGIVDIGGHVAQGYTPQLTMQGIIDDFERLRPVLEQQQARGEAKPADSVRLRPPLPRPGKILCCIGNYWEHAQREPRPLNMFMKNPEAVVGPGDTIRLPKLTEPWIFMHEAELALVIKGPAKEVRREDWRKAIFGYTGLIDVSARGEGRRTWKAGSWLGKSFDT